MSGRRERIPGLQGARDLRRVVLAEYRSGVSIGELAQDYGVTPGIVSDWLSEALCERIIGERPEE